MSSRHSSRGRSSKSKTPRVSSRHLKYSNVMVLKLVDPIVQSLLFILFIYSLDTSAEFSYRQALNLLVGWQIVSSIANLFFNPPNQLRTERLICLLLIIIYMPVFFYFQRHLKEVWVQLRQALYDDPTIPLYDIILESIAIIIAFWYYTICFREIRMLMGKGYGED